MPLSRDVAYFAVDFWVFLFAFWELQTTQTLTLPIWIEITQALFRRKIVKSNIIKSSLHTYAKMRRLITGWPLLCPRVGFRPWAKRAGERSTRGLVQITSSSAKALVDLSPAYERSRLRTHTSTWAKKRSCRNAFKEGLLASWWQWACIKFQLHVNCLLEKYRENSKVRQVK